MRKRTSQMLLNMILIPLFIIGFYLGFDVLGLPIMPSMFAGAGFAMLPLVLFILLGRGK